MKTSTVLILSAIAIIFIALTAFNFDLKASFLEGNYKNRFYGSEFTSVKNIDEIDVQCANKMTVIIEQGENEGIWIKKDNKDRLAWSRNGQVLRVGLSKEAKEDHGSIYLNTMTIISKDLSKISTHPLLSKKEEINYDAGKITITGFEQNQMNLVMNSLTSVIMQGNKLNQFNATVGDKESGQAQLELWKDNIIQSADFSVVGESSLKLDNPIIVKTNYQLSDEALVTLNGKSLQALLK